MLTKNKKILAVLAVVAAFCAASLGVDVTAVAACDSVNISYTNTHNATTNSYETTALTLSWIDARCGTKAYQVALNSGTTTLFSGSGTVAATPGGQTIVISPAVNAAAVTRVSLDITGR